MKVFVNPGHDPNVDSGAVNIDYDVREADVTKQAGALLERGLKRAGHEVMLLQSDDLDAVVEKIKESTRGGSRFSILAVAEGAISKEEAAICNE